MVDTGLVNQYLYGIPLEVQRIFANLGYHGGGIDSYEMSTLESTLFSLGKLLDFVMSAKDEEWNTNLAAEIPLLCDIIEVSIKKVFANNVSDSENHMIRKIMRLLKDIKDTVMSRRVIISKGFNTNTKVFHTIYDIEL